MPDTDDRLADDLGAGAIELIPGIGPVLAPFARRAFKNMRAEWARNSSKALRAAERLSGLSREELADRISENPRLTSLTIRVLYAAGMTGQDTILTALGTTLGHAIQDPEKIDEAELLLSGMTELRNHHIVILRIMTEKLPHPTEPDTFIYWSSEPLAGKSGYSRDLVNICIAGLMRSGLIRTVEDAYGVCYEISALGRTALEALDELNEVPQNEAR
jgi:hypothetical protein